MKKAFLRYVDAINSWVGRVIGFAVIPITVIATIEVLLRYAFNRPTIWAWEVNIQLMASTVTLGAGYALLHGAHVKMDAIVVTIDSNTKRAERIERIKVEAETEEPKSYDSDDGKPEYFNNNF